MKPNSNEYRQILIIEDEPDIRELLSEFIQDEGFTVQTAQNGKIAHEYLESGIQLPKLILLDLMMPIMDGFAFREKQMQSQELAQIPTAVLSADANVVKKATQMKVQEILKKPVDLEAVLNLAFKYCSSADSLKSLG